MSPLPPPPQAASPGADQHRAPGWLRMAGEARAGAEFLASLAAGPWLLRSPRGDGHSVIVYPGLIGSDFSTEPMRRLLRRLGHDVHGWGQGRNTGATPQAFDRAQAHLRALHQRSGRRVSLVGWSLGGLYARELAKREPQAVRCVISLGTPFTGPMRANNAWRVFEWLNRGKPRVEVSRDALSQAPPMPTTSIYSRSDGVVDWRCSVQAPGGQTENIEVSASHLGLGVNPLALHALADRLAQPEDAWLPFDRQGKRRWFYRDPGRVQAATAGGT